MAGRVERIGNSTVQPSSGGNFFGSELASFTPMADFASSSGFADES
jgi:hypothetical protein